MRRNENNERKESSRLSTMSKIAIGTVATGVILKETGNLKHISKALGDVSQTMSKVAKDIELTGRKGLTADKISDVFKTHIKNDDSTWKIARANQIHKVDSTRGAFGDLTKLRNISKEISMMKDKMDDDAILKDVMNSYHQKFKGLKDRDESFMKQLQTVTERALKREDIFFERNANGYTPMIDEFKEAVKGTKLENKAEEIADVMKEALDNAENIKKDISSASKINDNVSNEIESTFRDAILNKYSQKENATGDRAATAKEVWEELQSKKAKLNSTIANDNAEEFTEMLGRMIKDDAALGDIIVDAKTYRVDAQGQFYSLEDLRESSSKTVEAFSETIPGKLFGVKNLIEKSNAPSFYFMGEGTYNPGLAKALGGKDLLNKDVISIGDKIYEIAESGLKHIKEADGRTFESGRQGTNYGRLDRLFGNSAEKVQNNEFLKFLDINTKGGDAISKYQSIYKKFDKGSDANKDWGRNITTRLTSGYNINSNKESDVRAFYKDLRELSKMYNDFTDVASRKTISSLEEVLGGKAKHILQAINSDDSVAAFNKLDIDSKNIRNKDLDTLIKKVQRDPSTRNTMTRANKTANGSNNVLQFDDIFKRELLKEALMQDVDIKGQSVSGFSVTLSKLDNANLKPTELNNVKDLLTWSIIQERGGIYSRDAYRPKDFNEKFLAYGDILTMIQGKNQNAQEDKFLKEFKESIIRFGKDKSSIFQQVESNPNNLDGYTRPQWISVAKTINPLDIIKSLNDETKDTGGMVKQLGRQVIAGRNNADEVSSLTLLPFHFVNRLMTPLESLGLGFSNASTGSTLEYAKNIGLKRILPVAGVMFAASYLNYESENITGTSFTEAYQNAKSQFGVGMRVLTSPLDNYLERQRNFNPIANYWLGDHKDKEEYLDYLEYGYDPVRKGRFWSFGSASEFRGGKISYWEPNKLRQAHSNYKDIAIYGSSEEKWKHSILPTIRHPFSTLRYLSNPYWLEEKHYEDRPYPVSGKMFSEGTPWGAILNPTVGQLIKPQKRMHQEHLQGTLVDVRSIIQQRNNAIKDRAQENRLMRLDESGFTPMSFSPESMPTMNEAVYSIKVNNGQVVSAGYDGMDYAETMNDFSGVHVAPAGSAGVIAGSHMSYGVARLNNSFDNIQSANWLTGIASLVTSGAVSGESALSMISEINTDIRLRGQSSMRGEFFEQGNLHKNPYRRETQAQKLDYLENMVEYNTKKDFVNDMIYSTKQLSGMYGFLFDQVVPTEKQYKLEQAGKMASFTRSFWDESIGGLGGNVMEIARRFFPHENHNIEQINPIRNTMPEWMPVRFHTGDPYVKLPKGEARLPGAGYEALNKLHSDKYGRYGAFDRYKILADIAPLSEEYKTWKKIAKSEVQDPFLKKEMTAIEDRVKEQVKEHDFYNYKFLGKRMDTVNAVIDEVGNTGKFTIVGSSQEFSLAGIKPVKDEEGESRVHEYLKSGMKVQLSFEGNEYSNKDSTGRIAAIVSAGGQNLNQQMYEQNAAKEKDTKETLADERFNLTNANNVTGHIWEAIGHVPIPFIHNKFLRIDSSLEAYKKEQVYGTPYTTWDHPIKGFVKPAFQQAWASSPIHQGIGVGAWALTEYVANNSSSKFKRNLAETAFTLASPGAFAGAVIGAIPKMEISNKGLWNSHNGARIGATIGLVGYGLANTANPILSTANFAVAGAAAAEQLKFKGVGAGKGAMIGAGVGLALSALNPKSNIFNLTQKYIPKDTEKKWEIEEYFDRLEYLKYMNLFHMASREAKRKDGVDVHKIVNAYEYNKEKNAKYIERLEKQKLKAERMIDEKAKEELIANLDAKINDLLTPIQYMKAGEYTKAALAYKKAADTTIYGLSKDATTADVLRSLPKYDRDFFLDFANVKDPKERKKILKYVSPYKAKALKIMWGEEVEEVDSNKEFFSNHNLPGMFWSGWQSNVDLDHVKMKTIENEGMLLSDFGMYESTKNEPAAQAAPEIRNMNSAPNPIELRTNLLTLMNGVGFSDVDISVEQSNKPGIQMVTNIVRIGTYNINNAVSSTLNKLIL